MVVKLHKIMYTFEFFFIIMSIKVSTNSLFSARVLQGFIVIVT